MFAEDTALFFADFAVDGSLDGATVRGIFDAEYALAEVGTSGMAATAPVYTLPTAQVPAAPVGKLLLLPTGRWKIAEHQPDGTGMSLLLLERTQ